MTAAPLLLVDGTNVVMRCAFGGEIPVEQCVPAAALSILRAAREIAAQFLIIALDSPRPGWREALCPSYKSHRTTDTTPFTNAARVSFERRGWYCVASPQFEADDVIATIVARLKRPTGVAIFSTDSDLLTLTALGEGITILRPTTEGFGTTTATDVMSRYGIAPQQLPDYKAMVGEPVDSIVGVPRVGPKTAQRLLEAYGTLERILTASGLDGDKDVRRVREHGDVARMARRLTTLRTNVPLPPIAPTACYFHAEAAA